MNQILNFDKKNKKVEKQINDEFNSSNLNYQNSTNNLQANYFNRGISGNSFGMQNLSQFDYMYKSKKKNLMPLKIATIVIVFITIITVGYLALQIKQTNEANQKIIALRDKIIIEVSEIDGKINLKVDSINEIDKIVYSWNNDTEKEQVIKGDGRLEITNNDIVIPIGENNFTITVFDNKGNKENLTKKFISQAGKDIEKPKINIVANGGIIQVEITDDVEIKDIKYKWEGEKEETLLPKPDSKNKFKFELKPKEGDSTLVVIARDTSENTYKKEELFKGVVKPKVEVHVTSDNSKAFINAKHPVGIKRLEYSINGVEKVKEFLPTDLDKKDATITEILAIGLNNIKVKAISEEGYESLIFHGQVTREQNQLLNPPVNPQTETQNNTNNTNNSNNLNNQINN